MSEDPQEFEREPDSDLEHGEQAEAPPRTPMTQQLGRIVVLLLLLLFVVFAVSNSQPVDFDWIFGETEVTDVDPATGETTGGVPLIVLLLVAFVIGALSGATLVRIRRRRARAAERDR